MGDSMTGILNRIARLECCILAVFWACPFFCSDHRRRLISSGHVHVSKGTDVACIVAMSSFSHSGNYSLQRSECFASAVRACQDGCARRVVRARVCSASLTWCRREGRRDVGSGEVLSGG